MTQVPGPPYPPSEPTQPQQPYQVPVQPFPSYPTSAVPFPASAPPGPYGYFPPPPPPSPPSKRRGVLIASLAVAILLLLCGSGGAAAWLLTHNGPGGKGQASAVEAVQGFLTAVYQDLDPTKAATYVCSAARDKKKLTNKINQIKLQNAGYDTPKYDWDTPTTEETKSDEAILSTTITLTTADEQVATQKLRFVATKNNGWWVCEVTQVT